MINTSYSSSPAFINGKVLKKIAAAGFLLAAAFAAGSATGHDDMRRERPHQLLKMSMASWYKPYLAGRFRFFQATESEGEDTNDETPKGHDNTSFIMSLVIGTVLFGISFYLWYLVKKRQLATEQLDILRSELINLFDNAPCGYHSIDERGYFASINRTLSLWLGYEKEELIGKIKFTDLVDEQDRPKIENISGVRKTHLDIELRTKEGGTLPVILSVVTSVESHEQGQRVLYSTIDNSRCRQALERIKNLDQELEAFSYSISHDLRAPLRSIDGYSKILQEDYAGKLDEEGRRVLNVIMNNARRMGKLIDDLLEFGRLGRKSIQRSYVNMTSLVNAVVQELLLQEAGRRIDIDVGELHPAFADADMIRQVWHNLLGNAIKYTGKKEVATIRVHSCKTEEGEIFYEVRDNGEGFDMKYAGKLFGVFQRLHKIQDFAGTGVGLAIVKRIISRHGGRVWAEGELHVGAVFYFTIPTEDENS